MPAATGRSIANPLSKDSMRHFVTPFAFAALAAFTAIVSTPAAAGEVFAGVGTTGAEFGYAAKLAPNGGLRVDAEFLSLTRKFEDNGATYDTKLKFTNLGLYGDLFLTDNFRFSGGAAIGSRKVSGTGVSSGGTITINGQSYVVSGGDSIVVDAKFPSVSPYLGLGYGHGQASGGLGFYFDAGAVFGKPKVKLTPSASLAQKVAQSDVDAEQAKLQDKMNKLRAYPVIKLGLSYGF
jgi:hypothetical protein